MRMEEKFCSKEVAKLQAQMNVFFCSRHPKNAKYTYIILTFIVCSIQVDHNLVDQFLVNHMQTLR